MRHRHAHELMCHSYKAPVHSNRNNNLPSFHLSLARFQSCSGTAAQKPTSNSVLKFLVLSATHPRMKIWNCEHTFNHPWETVATAAWRKYPNPHNPAVIGTDVVERKVVDGVLHTQRLVSSIWYFPKWAQALIGSAKICYAAEHSEVNPGARHMVLKTINLTFCRHIAVNETLKYIPHPADPSKTLLRQEAVVTVQGVPLTNYMEDILTTKISTNASKGRQAMEWVINKINEEVQDLTRSTDEILHSTKKSFDDLTTSAKKSMDDISHKAKKSFDEIQHLKINSNFSEC